MVAAVGSTFCYNIEHGTLCEDGYDNSATAVCIDV